MATPIAVRDVAAAVGLLIVLGTAVSVVGTVIVPRKSGSRLTRLVASAVSGSFGLIVRPVASYQWRDRIMAGPAWHPARVEHQLLTHDHQQPGDHLDRRSHPAGLDRGNPSLGRSGAQRE